VQRSFEQLDSRAFHGVAKESRRGALAGNSENIERLAHLCAQLAHLARPALPSQKGRQMKSGKRLLAHHAGCREPLAALLVSMLRGGPVAQAVIDLGVQKIDPKSDAGSLLEKKRRLHCRLSKWACSY